MKTKQIENALRGFAAGCAEEDIEAYCNTGAFSNGKKGFLFSKKGLYGSMFDHLRKKNPIPQPICAYSARTAHPFQRNGAPFRFKLSKAQQVD